MKFFLALLLLTTTLQLCFTFDLAAYKNQYQAEVAVPLKNAMDIYASNIMEYLAQTQVPTTVDEVRQVRNILNQKGQAFIEDMGSASTAGDGLRQQLDREGASLPEQVIQVKKQIDFNAQQQKKLNFGMTSVHQAVLDAEYLVFMAQENLQKCMEEGTRKHVGDLPCKDLEQNLTSRQQWLDKVLASQNRNEQRQISLQQIGVALQTTLNQLLTVQPEQINLARDNINGVVEKSKSVISFISISLKEDHLLVNAIKNLIDIEAVIKPLTAILDQIIIYTPNPADAEVLNSLKQKITLNLPLVQLKLTRYALVPPD